MISVFTPSHDPQWLGDCYRSLAAQTVAIWEWVVVPNGPRADAVAGVAGELARADSRVRVSRSSRETLGGLKRDACDAARGDIFLELDHDDELLPPCLEEVLDAVRGGADFVYSDSLSWAADGGTDAYATALGWASYPVPWRGATRLAYRSFPAAPRSLCEIYFAPNHVRAWTRAAYARAGGHDPAMAVADDHDLLCRTYLAGATFRHVPECLYAYRRHATNTHVARADEVARRQAEVGDRYLRAMVREWCRREGKLMVDLGGAHGCPRQEGWRALDRVAAPGVEYVADVTRGLPFADGAVGAFRAADFVEHLSGDDVPAVMNRLYDALADGGWLLSDTPAVAGPDGTVGLGAFQDPTHRSYWSLNNWDYFTDRELARYVPEIACRFQLVRGRTGWPSAWHRRRGLPYVTADLLAVKGDTRPPGELRI